MKISDHRLEFNNKGVTRFVILLFGIAIKIPKFWKWTHFLRGLLANMDEYNTWRWNSGKYDVGNSYLLAPVLWCGFGGLLLIMRRAEPITQLMWVENKWIIKEHRLHFGGDDTISNYGLLDGKMVKIDYGQLDNFYGEDFKEINCAHEPTKLVIINKRYHCSDCGKKW